MLVKFYGEAVNNVRPTIGQITINATSIDHIVLEEVNKNEILVSFVGTVPEIQPTPTLKLNLQLRYPDRYFTEFTFGEVVLHIGMNSVNITTDAHFIAEYKDDVIPENRFRLMLYRNSAEPSRVDKTEYLEWVDNLDGALRDECPIVAPVILIEYPQVIDFNYVYIEAFKRYYYVKNFTSVRTNLWQLELNVDVLMTYKDGIKSLQAFVDRNEFENNTDVIDDKVIIEQGYEIEDNVVTNDVFLNESGTNYGVSFILCGYGLEVK